MASSDLISVIVPVYNVENYIRKCLESIIHQTYSKLEIIIVDDGSTDKSGIICDEYAKKDDRIKVIHKKNGGLSDARNVGLKSACGNIVGFVDSDDTIDSRMYEILYKNMQDTGADISICDYQRVEDNHTVNQISFQNNIIICDKMEAFKKLLGDEIQSYTWNKLYKKDLFNGALLPVNRKFEDMGTFYKLLERSAMVVVSNYCGYHYYIRTNSITSTMSDDMVNDYVEMSGLMLNSLDKYMELKADLFTAKVRHTILIHNLCVKDKKKEIYNSEKVNNLFKECRKITRDNKKIFKSLGFNKLKTIVSRVLFLNKNLYYFIFSKIS